MVNFLGATGKNLRNMQEAARRSNSGKPRSAETKKKIGETRRRLQIERGAPVSPFFDGLGMFLRYDKGWGNGKSRYSVFVNGKKVTHAVMVYKKFNGEIKKGYIIHHINNDSLDDRPENLISLPRFMHNELHKYWRYVEHWTKQKIAGELILQEFLKLYDNYLKK